MSCHFEVKARHQRGLPPSEGSRGGSCQPCFSWQPLAQRLIHTAGFPLYLTPLFHQGAVTLDSGPTLAPCGCILVEAITATINKVTFQGTGLRHKPTHTQHHLMNLLLEVPLPRGTGTSSETKTLGLSHSYANLSETVDLFLCCAFIILF